jgi:antitoxin MazE
MQVAKWGNSLAVRLPAGLVQELALKAGDEVVVRAVKDSDAKLTLAVERKRTKAEVIASMANSKWKLPDGYRFDREEANSRGSDERR